MDSHAHLELLIQDAFRTLDKPELTKEILDYLASDADITSTNDPIWKQMTLDDFISAPFNSKILKFELRWKAFLELINSHNSATASVNNNNVNIINNNTSNSAFDHDISNPEATLKYINAQKTKEIIICCHDCDFNNIKSNNYSFLDVYDHIRNCDVFKRIYKNLRCQYCNNISIDYDDLCSHICKIHYKLIPVFCCVKCKFNQNRLSRPYSLIQIKEHLLSCIFFEKTSHFNSVYNCGYCNYHNENRLSLVDHLSNHFNLINNEKVYPIFCCDGCNFNKNRSSTDRMLRAIEVYNHLIDCRNFTNQKINLNGLSCEYCKAIFIGRDILIKHICVVHFGLNFKNQNLLKRKFF